MDGHWDVYALMKKYGPSTPECGKEEAVNMANLRGELRNAVVCCFQEGTKKREYKQKYGRDMDSKIFSYGSKKALLDRAGELATFVQKKHPEIRHVKEIKNQHIREYLQEKQEIGCTKATISTYHVQIKKLAKCCNKVYKSVNAQWSDVKIPDPPTLEERLRKDMMTTEQYQEILECANECSSLDGIRLCRNFGLRVQEIPRIRVCDIDFENMRLKIFRSKGGRTWEIPIETEEQRNLLEHLCRGKQSGQQLVSIRKESLNRYLHSLNDKAGNKNLLDQKTGFHAIRKLVAQERYNQNRKNGMGKEEALNEVNRYLGHGDNRRILSNTYVTDQW